jgi:hypothetical protein
MRWLVRGKHTLRSLLRHRQVDAELEDEFRDHLERGSKTTCGPVCRRTTHGWRPSA